MGQFFNTPGSPMRQENLQELDDKALDSVQSARDWLSSTLSDEDFDDILINLIEDVEDFLDVLEQIYLDDYEDEDD